MSMNLTDIRQMVRVYGRNAGDVNYYSTAMIDAAILRFCADFLQETRCVKIATTVDIVASTNTADFSSIAGLLKGRIERARVVVDTNYTKVYEDLDDVNLDDVLDRLTCDSTTGTPCMFAFSDSVTAKFYPAPKADGTLSVTYAPLQTSFTVGTRGAWSSGVAYIVGDVVSDSGSLYRSLVPNNTAALTDTASWDNLGTGTLVAPANIVSVIADGLLVQLIGYASAAFLQSTDPEHDRAVASEWSRYEAFRLKNSGVGSISGKSSAGQLRRRVWG